MNALGLIEQQLQRMKSRPGFVAAPDQSDDCTSKLFATYALLDGAVQSIFEASTVKQEPRKRSTAESNGLKAAA